MDRTINVDTRGSEFIYHGYEDQRLDRAGKDLIVFGKTNGTAMVVDIVYDRVIGMCWLPLKGLQ